MPVLQVRMSRGLKVGAPVDMHMQHMHMHMSCRAIECHSRAVRATCRGTNDHAADRPRLAEARSSPRHDLALRKASGAPAGGCGALQMD